MVTSKDLKPVLPALRCLSSPAALKVLLTLVAYSDKYGRSWPSWRKIGRAVGLSRASVARGLQQLEAAGLVTRQPAPQGRGFVYVIGLNPETSKGLNPETPGVSTLRPPHRVSTLRPSTSRKPRESGILGTDPCSGHGLNPETPEVIRDHKKANFEGAPPGGSPPASRACGEPPSEEPQMKLGVRLLEALLAVAPMSSYCWLPAVHPEDLREAVRWLEERNPEAAQGFRSTLRSLFGRDGWKKALEMLRTEPVVAVRGFLLELRRRVDMDRVFAAWTRLLEAEAATKDAPLLQRPPDGGGPPRRAPENTGLHEVPR